MQARNKQTETYGQNLLGQRKKTDFVEPVELKKESIILKFNKESSPDVGEVARPSFLQKEKPATLKNYLEDLVPSPRQEIAQEQAKGVERVGDTSQSMAQYNLTPDIAVAPQKQSEVAPSVLTNVFVQPPAETTISHEAVNEEHQENELRIENQPTETDVKVEPNLSHKTVEEIPEKQFKLESDA